MRTLCDCCDEPSVRLTALNPIFRVCHGCSRHRSKNLLERRDDHHDPMWLRSRETRPDLKQQMKRNAQTPLGLDAA